eukprot:gnl/TRDRNA2_/TRDRNA2_86082_c1_seq1.p1 gnl/TRDRNA2_/TRDRNA2_86082_c1~~gnl/TRDRNA2_/TRDRNA2_86082_c1_seq1.p1  ORF type:complete len:513 (-),score=99.46 gnl/TRDRNA2_/TRDRNA2_86082_c1_seq1:105-1643(-)
MMATRLCRCLVLLLIAPSIAAATDAFLEDGISLVRLQGRPTKSSMLGEDEDDEDHADLGDKKDVPVADVLLADLPLKTSYLPLTAVGAASASASGTDSRSAPTSKKDDGLPSIGQFMSDQDRADKKDLEGQKRLYALNSWASGAGLGGAWGEDATLKPSWQTMFPDMAGYVQELQSSAVVQDDHRDEDSHSTDGAPKLINLDTTVPGKADFPWIDLAGGDTFSPSMVEDPRITLAKGEAYPYIVDDAKRAKFANAFDKAVNEHAVRATTEVRELREQAEGKISAISSQEQDAIAAAHKQRDDVTNTREQAEIVQIHNKAESDIAAINLQAENAKPMLWEHAKSAKDAATNNANKQLAEISKAHARKNAEIRVQAVKDDTEVERDSRMLMEEVKRQAVAMRAKAKSNAISEAASLTLENVKRMKEKMISDAYQQHKDENGAVEQQLKNVRAIQAMQINQGHIAPIPANLRPIETFQAFGLDARNSANDLIIHIDPFPAAPDETPPISEHKDTD